MEFSLGWSRKSIAPRAHSGSNSQALGANPAGYDPTWKFVAPPGFGDAPQHVFSTFTLIPLDIRGPGDNPFTYLRSFLAPNVQNFAMRYQGMPVQGGNFLFTSLYTPDPMQSPANDLFAGAPSP